VGYGGSLGDIVFSEGGRVAGTPEPCMKREGARAD